jgi:hypothetical protein
VRKIFRGSGKKHRTDIGGSGTNRQGRRQQRVISKVKEELRNHEKLQAKVQEIVKTLKETGKEKINATDSDSVNGKTRQGSHAIMNCEVSTDKKHGLIVKGRV